MARARRRSCWVALAILALLACAVVAPQRAAGQEDDPPPEEPPPEEPPPQEPPAAAAKGKTPKELGPDPEAGTVPPSGPKSMQPGAVRPGVTAPQPAAGGAVPTAGGPAPGAAAPGATPPGTTPAGPAAGSTPGAAGPAGPATPPTTPTPSAGGAVGPTPTAGAPGAATTPVLPGAGGVATPTTGGVGVGGAGVGGVPAGGVGVGAGGVGAGGVGAGGVGAGGVGAGGVGAGGVGAGGVPSSDPPKNTTGIGFLFPDPDSAVLKGLKPSDNGCALVNTLLGALGASDTSACGATSSAAGKPGKPGKAAAAAGASGRPGFSIKRTSSGGEVEEELASTDRSRGAGGTAGQSLSFAEMRGSNRLTDGLVVAPDGSAFCIAGEGMIPKQAPHHGPSHAALGVAAAPYDPTCDDDSIAAKPSHCPGAAAGGGGSAISGNGGTSFMAADAAQAPTACTRGFTKVGSFPRSLGIVLIRWTREYYKTKEQCCKNQGNRPGCGCLFGNSGDREYDDLPPPSAYSRYFTDECDNAPSINRAYYDASGGRVTFHSKLRVTRPTTNSAISAGRVAARTAAAMGGAASPSPSPELAAATQPVLTNAAYLDPDGVDVYGWVTLSAQRTPDGKCRDFCGDAIQLAGMNQSEYNHVICMSLNDWSAGVCNVCTPSATTACAGTCPAESGITGGCGCGTCDFAWGGQNSCSRPAPPGIRVGLRAPVSTWGANMTEDPMWPGGRRREFVRVAVAQKTYMSHELGHNMGLTHTGAINCRVGVDGVIERAPTSCVPDWYGDATSYMGSGQSLQLPNVIKYKVHWLPRGTLREHPLGTEARYVIKAATSRRPSLQESNELRGFDPVNDVLTVRIPLTSPNPETERVVTTSSFKCPCNPNNACPSCTAATCSTMGSTPCCTDPGCADAGLAFLYIELHQPYRNDYWPDTKGVAIRMMGHLSNCTSTRMVPTHVDEAGKLKYLLNVPDPNGTLPGSVYVDALRGVSVVLEQWTRSQATVRVRA